MKKTNYIAPKLKTASKPANLWPGPSSTPRPSPLGCVARLKDRYTHSMFEADTGLKPMSGGPKDGLEATISEIPPHQGSGAGIAIIRG